MKRIFTVIALCCALIFLGVPVSAFAGALAEHYVHTSVYTEPNWIPPYGMTIADKLNNMGYSGATWPNWTAAQVASSMRYDAVILTQTHGMPGQLLLHENTFLNARLPYGPSGNSVLLPTSLNAKFAGFFGCKTGATSPLYGNLVDAAVNNGAQCALGFTQDVVNHAAVSLESLMLNHLSAGRSVGLSLNYALLDLRYDYAGSDYHQSVSYYYYNARGSIYDVYLR